MIEQIYKVFCTILKTFDKKIMIFRSNHNLTQRDQIFNMVNLMRTLGLCVNLNLLIVHHHIIII